MKVEYKVRPVTRFVVTRWHEAENCGGSQTIGEYASNEAAFHVAYALCKQEHQQLGYPPGDERIQYPEELPPVSKLTEPV